MRVPLDLEHASEELRGDRAFKFTAVEHDGVARLSNERKTGPGGGGLLRLLP